MSMMSKPPFKLAVSASAARPATVFQATLQPACCGEPEEHEAAASTGRTRLAQLHAHLHCSIIGTCLGTNELAKQLARHADIKGMSDVEIHHEAVSLTHQGGAVAKALHKALDQKHDAAIRSFAKAQDEHALATLWRDALAQGEVPGAYWALLTHRLTTPELRQKAFGEVHMLSHLVGAANRADIRRLEALTHENADLQERVERQQLRTQETLAQRDQTIAQLQAELAELRGRLASVTAGQGLQAPAEVRGLYPAQASAQVALQTERRERAEQAMAAAQSEATRLQEELIHTRQHVQVQGRELAAAEIQLREMVGIVEEGKAKALEAQLRGRCVVYVGGRPSSTPAIRDLVLRHGGDFRKHDGGLEDRKGLLAAAVAAADVVVFPVDCIDHDSAGNLKRLCTRQGIAYVPIRNASVTSFAAALLEWVPLARAN